MWQSWTYDNKSTGSLENQRLQSCGVVFPNVARQADKTAFLIVAREPRDAAAVVFGLKFANNIHYKFKSS